MLDRVIPMLPVELSNGCCSLSKEVLIDMQCHVLWRLTKRGDIIDADVFKSVINVTKRMNYHEVQLILIEIMKRLLVNDDEKEELC